MRFGKLVVGVAGAAVAVAGISGILAFGELLRAKGGGDGSYPYFVAVPRSEESRPLLVFLHPAGRQSSLRIQGEVALLALLDGALDAIVVAPLSQDGGGWSVRRLEALLDDLEASYDTDGSVFVVGFSMGAFGAWAMAEQLPHRVTAIVPVAGGFPHNAYACGERPVPVWAIHGAEDRSVPPEASIELVDLFRGCGAEVRLTVLPEVGHQYRAHTLARLKVFDWLASHVGGPEGAV
jgi:predicted peptidase